MKTRFRRSFDTAFNGSEKTKKIAPPLSENGKIVFGVPSEIYADYFERYCADGLAPDKFFARADRRFSAYLNEQKLRYEKGGTYAV